MRRTTVVISSTITALVAIGALAVSGAAQQTGRRAITVVERGEQVKISGNGMPAFGASLAFNARLTSPSGQTIGKLLGSGGFASATKVVATAVYVLRDGQLDVILAATPGYRKAVAAVIGGTGAYTSARGTVTSVAGSAGSFTDTFRLTSP